MLTTVALFFFCLTLIAKVEVRSSVTHIIIACRPNGTVATEVPSVATCFSLAIFAGHFTPPSNSRDNDYSTTAANVKLYKFLGISDRIGAYGQFTRRLFEPPSLVAIPNSGIGYFCGYGHNTPQIHRAFNLEENYG